MVALRVLSLLVVSAAGLKVKEENAHLRNLQQPGDPNLVSLGKPKKQDEPANPVMVGEPANPDNPVAVFHTDMGTMEVELFMDKAPITVSNFIDLANSGFYSGLHFHRVIPNFMIQFGCPYSKDPKSLSAGTGGPAPNSKFINLANHTEVSRNSGGNIPDECPGMSNEVGTLSMANTGAPQTGGSQFFINVKHNSYLDCFDPSTNNNHPVFGKIIKHYAVAVLMSRVDRSKSDKPKFPLKMLRVEIKNMNALKNQEALYSIRHEAETEASKPLEHQSPSVHTSQQE